MNRFFSGSLMILGVIFIIVIFIGVGFYIASTQNPGTKSSSSVTNNPNTNTGTVVGATPTPRESTPFVLTDGQKQAINSFGIDPSTIPLTVSPEVEACFVSALGGEKVAEIKAGGIPSAFDFFKAKGCI